MHNISTNLRRLAPAFLTVIGVCGVVGTAATAIHATPKALKIIDIKKREKNNNYLNPIEIVRMSWKCYIPTIIVSTGTIACIIGIGITNKRNQAALFAAYAMLDKSYKRYRNAAINVYGTDADKNIRIEAAKDAMVYTSDWGYQVYNKKMENNEKELLFHDLISDRYFTTTMAAVLNAQYHVNRNIALRGTCSVNEYLSFLGIDEMKNGDEMGWDISYMAEEMDSYWLDFDNQKIILDDGTQCIAIDTIPVNHFEYL